MRINKNDVPKFENEEQEAEYWDKHSPLDLVAEPDLQKVRVGGTKDRPIAIRLDRKTRAKLDGMAAKQGVGPSTFARLLIIQAIENKETLPKTIDMDVMMKTLAHSGTQIHESKTEKDVYQTDFGNNEQSASLVFHGQRKEWERFAGQFLTQLVTVSGVRLVISEE